MGGRLFPPHLYTLCRAAHRHDAPVSRVPHACARGRQSAMPVPYPALCVHLSEYEQNFAVIVREFQFVSRYFIGGDLGQCRFVCRFGGA